MAEGPRTNPILFSILVIAIIVAVLSGAILAFVYFTKEGAASVQFGKSFAVVEIHGTLTSGNSIPHILHEYGKQDGIKAIILSIDSPGGGVAPSQEIYREIERVREKKPVVAYMEGTAASGGYYVASAATKGWIWMALAGTCASFR